MKEITPSEALHKLAAYCSKGEQCISDIQKKLERWNILESERGAIINRLLQEKFVDEKRYCRSFILDKSKFAHWGKIKIAFALRQKGIAQEVIQEQLNELANEIENEDTLLHLLQTKNKSIKAKNDLDRRNKLIRFAIGRGFSFNEIQKVIRQQSFFSPFEE